MNNYCRLLAACLLALFLLPALCFAENKEDDFDFILVVTQQDINMDWWFAVPPQFVPQVSQVSAVARGEKFNIVPFFNNYGLSEKNEARISYSIEVVASDGTIDDQVSNIEGYSGAVAGPYLLPAQGRLTYLFEPEDRLGEYDIRITAFDQVKQQKAFRSQKIKLQEFVDDVKEVDLDRWFLAYPSSPQPTLALASFTRSPVPYLSEDGTPLWAGLWFYKHIFTENGFLLPHAVQFYNSKASLQQKKDLLLLFYLLNSLDQLAVEGELQSYVQNLESIIVPDPYQEVVSGSQLDMLWAEFFATSRIKPVRQILTAINLSVHAGTIEKWKAGELEQNDNTMQKVMLDATFQSAMWSIASNCRQSELLLQYCLGLYESDALNEVEKGYLGGILARVIEERQREQQAKGEVERGKL